jgi:tetratricopeptide (TPR) repeat protein
LAAGPEEFVLERSFLKMKDAGKNDKSGAPPPTSKLWLMRLAAVVAMPILFLLLIELGLRIFGYGHPTAFLLPSVNHGRKTWIENNEFGWRFFGRRKEKTPAAISILLEKPPGVTRIFVFGESAAFGDPQPAFGLPRVLQATLSLRHPDMKFEVINAAMTAIDSHVILPIVRDCAKAGGDIWVIYMGNNEVVGPFGAGTVFGTRAMPLPLVRANVALKTTRMGQWLDALREKWQELPADKSEGGGMMMFLNRQIREDDPGMKTVYQSFEKNLSDIIRAGQKSGAGVVVSTVAVNLKDCAPFASAPGKSNDPGSAEFQFRLAKSLFASGDVNGARAAFIRARDLDTLRFRCDSRLNSIIRKAAANRDRERVFLADAEQAFAGASPGGVPGWNLFYEHVHLTFEGNCLLARALAEQVEKLLPAKSSDTPHPWPAVGDCARRLGRTDRDLQAALTEVLGRLANPPFVTQINHTEQINYLTAGLREAGQRANLPDALRAAQTALKLNPDDPQLCQQLAEVQKSAGQWGDAEISARRAVDLLPSSAEDWSQLGLILAQEKKFEPAAEACQRSFDLNPRNEAVRQFEEALKRSPTNAMAGHYLELIHAGTTPGAR